MKLGQERKTEGGNPDEDDGPGGILDVDASGGAESEADLFLRTAT